jgi:hypothetical protein
MAKPVNNASEAPATATLTINFMSEAPLLPPINRRTKRCLVRKKKTSNFLFSWAYREQTATGGNKMRKLMALTSFLALGMAVGCQKHSTDSMATTANQNQNYGATSTTSNAVSSPTQRGNAPADTSTMGATQNNPNR